MRSVGDGGSDLSSSAGVLSSSGAVGHRVIKLRAHFFFFIKEMTRRGWGGGNEERVIPENEEG